MADQQDKQDRKAALATWKAQNRAAATSLAKAEQPLGKRPCPQCGYQLISIDTFCPKCRDAVATMRMQARIGGVIAVVFSVWTAYIVWDGFTWWALLTGLIAALYWGWLVEGITKNPGRLAKAGIEVEREQQAKSAAEVAKKRIASQAEPKPDLVCVACGRSASRIESDYAKLEKKGMLVFKNPSGPLLHCNRCRESYCGKCAIDEGMSALCPKCRSVIG